MSEHDPKTVARNMLLTRGKEDTINRLRRYIAGDIRSENSKEFWETVLAEVEKMKELF